MKANRCKKVLLEDNVCGLDADHEGECGKPWIPWKRANYVPAPHFYNLNQACAIINDALANGYGCFLVGSSLTRRDWRDIDVRFIMQDEEYDRMFRRNGGYLDPLWSLMCTTISAWLSQQSGLPVDFQIQRQTEANATHEGRRSALGIFRDYPGERPSDLEATKDAEP